jgi:hypothetical protein
MAVPNVWTQMNYVAPRGQCNYKQSVISPRCPCLRFMLHPLKVRVSDVVQILATLTNTCTSPPPRTNATGVVTTLLFTAWKIRPKTKFASAGNRKRETRQVWMKHYSKGRRSASGLLSTKLRWQTTGCLRCWALEVPATRPPQKAVVQLRRSLAELLRLEREARSQISPRKRRMRWWKLIDAGKHAC